MSRDKIQDPCRLMMPAIYCPTCRKPAVHVNAAARPAPDQPLYELWDVCVECKTCPNLFNATVRFILPVPVDGLPVRVYPANDPRYPEELRLAPYGAVILEVLDGGKTLKVEDSTGSMYEEPTALCEFMHGPGPVPEIGNCPSCGKPMVIGDEGEEERCCWKCYCRKCAEES